MKLINCTSHTHVPQLKEDCTLIHPRNLKIQQSLKLNLNDLMSTRKTKRCWEEKAPLDITKLILKLESNF